MRFRFEFTLLLLLALAIFSCRKEPQQKGLDSSRKPPKEGSVTLLDSLPEFSGEVAFQYLRIQTDFGPRNPGSPGYSRCKEYLINELRYYAEVVTTQSFTGFARGKTYSLTNIIASFNSQSPDRVLFCAHWDTRPWADMDSNRSNRKKPILGANDGASGVAVLLELARIFHRNPPPIGVDIVLFDGEDLGQEGDLSGYAQGSKYFADHKDPAYNPRYGILLDMIGEKDVRIPKEQYSLKYAFSVVNYAWSVAHQLAMQGRIPIQTFSDVTGPAVYDDHIPLNQVGIPTIDLIDFDYPYWHTLEDTPDKCSANSLAAVGTLLTTLAYMPSALLQ